MRPSLRLLLIGERAEYRLLVQKHVEIEWPQAVIVEHRLGEDTPLDEHFAAAGFDAVVIVGAPPATQPEMLAAALRARPEFAPIVLVVLQDGPPEVASVPGLHRLYGRKIDRTALLRALTGASRERSNCRRSAAHIRISRSATASAR